MQISQLKFTANFANLKVKLKGIAEREVPYF